MKLQVALAAMAPACLAFTFTGLVQPRQAKLMRMNAEPATEEPAVPAVEAVAAVGEAAAPKRKSKEGAMALADVVEGQKYEGTVVGVANYGAFVDIGAVSDGLVHISELSDRFVTDVASIVSVGDKVEVRVMSCDSEKKQLSLSMKPEGSSGPSGEGGGQRRSGGGGGNSRSAKIEKLKEYVNADETAFIDGTVSNVQSWGAFVTVADGIDGLVHISRVADERTEDLESVLTPGQTVKVRVIDVDLEKGTLGLAMDSYRERRAYNADDGDDNGEGFFGGGGGGDRARAPRFYANEGEGGEGGQQRRRVGRSEPGDDIWETKPSEMFDWREAMATARVELEEADEAAFKVVEGKLILN